MLFNLTRLKTATNDNPQLRKQVIDYYLETTPAHIERLGGEIRAGRWGQVACLAHEILNTISIVGAVQMKKPLRDIEENALEEKNLETIDARLQYLRELHYSFYQEVISQRPE